MPTEKLRIQWLQIEQNGFRIIWKKMVTEELGYVDTEELETKSYRRTQNTMVIDLRSKWLQKNWEKLLQKNLKDNGYRRNWNKIVTE